MNNVSVMAWFLPDLWRYAPGLALFGSIFLVFAILALVGAAIMTWCVFAFDKRTEEYDRRSVRTAAFILGAAAVIFGIISGLGFWALSDEAREAKQTEQIKSEMAPLEQEAVIVVTGNKVDITDPITGCTLRYELRGESYQLLVGSAPKTFGATPNEVHERFIDVCGYDAST